MKWNLFSRASRKSVGGVMGMLFGGDAAGMGRSAAAFIKEGYAENPIAFKCISMVARAISTLPVDVYRGETLVKNHPAIELLRRPNPHRSGAQFFEELLTDYQATGNAYARKIVVGADKVKELWRFPSTEMTVLPGEGGMVGRFEHRTMGSKETYDVDPLTGTSEVNQWRTANPLSNLYGLSPLNPAALAIDSHTAASKWNFKLLRNGSKRSGFLIHKPGEDEASLTDEQRTKLKADLKAKWTGAQGSDQGGVMLLGGSFDFKEASMSPHDMDWSNSKHSAAAEIALCLGVPGQLVGVPDAQTYANNEEARLALYLFTVLPQADYFFGELGRFILADGEHFEVDRDQVEALAPLRDKKWTRATTAAGVPILTPNEARNEVGFPEVVGGDEILIASSLLPLGAEPVPPPVVPPIADPAAAGKAAYGA